MAAMIEWAIAEEPFPGEATSGDRCLIKMLPGKAFVAVVDALGHGKNAAPVADMAVHLLNQHAEEPIEKIFHRCHAALSDMRGVVMSVAIFDELQNTLTWLAVGNVEGVLLREQWGKPPLRESLPLRGGVVGYR